jgi:hypothetical protein
MKRVDIKKIHFNIDLYIYATYSKTEYFKKLMVKL